VSAPTQAPLEARNLVFSFAQPVIRDISFCLAAGTLTGVIGPNGSGKTTLLRLLNGILHPQSGAVLLNGDTPLTALRRKAIARRIAMVPQNGGLYQDQTVFQYAMQGRSPHLPLLGFESTRDEQIVEESLEMTQLTHYRRARVAEISGGEKQRLLLARALAQRAEILLLDEFTANLDINYQVELMRLVGRITKENNLATLIVSHEISLLSTFAHWIILMDRGEIVHQGMAATVVTPENLKKLFGLNFATRPHPDGSLEVLPILKEGKV
jgi:ABC-type cobalamin/Fe3+-siderophores transport system ATPase subunit